jgi:hypothetical protein
VATTHRASGAGRWRRCPDHVTQSSAWTVCRT